tara:strand:- start:931 stop:2112 length:1182 start_codon:yes stop_codon:yes gene_type:complete
MKIDSVDFFYLALPEIQNIGDGSQDSLLVRITADGHVGWGESETAPLVSIANWCHPMSHSACKPMRDTVLGQTLDDPADIDRITVAVQADGLDTAQTDHTFAGVEIAMWDLLGRKLEEPAYRLLGYDRAYPKTPYASMLFGDTPQETLEGGKRARAEGYRAAKFGWGPYGRGTVEEDRDHVFAAREGLGTEGILLVDAGTVWVDDVAMAEPRLAALQETDATWLEEPFIGQALTAYRDIAAISGSVKLAGGEGAKSFYEAQHLIDYGNIGFVQIDTGRIGGLAPSKQVADYAVAKGITFVNHTFTTQIALSASLQPFAGLEHHTLCEFPVQSSEMAVALTGGATVPRDANGDVLVPEAPGIGMEPDLTAVKPYLQDVKIRVNDEEIYRSSTIN